MNDSNTWSGNSFNIVRKVLAETILATTQSLSLPPSSTLNWSDSTWWELRPTNECSVSDTILDQMVRLDCNRGNRNQNKFQQYTCCIFIFSSISSRCEWNFERRNMGNNCLPSQSQTTDEIYYPILSKEVESLWINSKSAGLQPQVWTLVALIHSLSK